MRSTTRRAPPFTFPQLKTKQKTMPSLPSCSHTPTRPHTHTHLLAKLHCTDTHSYKQPQTATHIRTHQHSYKHDRLHCVTAGAIRSPCSSRLRLKLRRSIYSPSPLHRHRRHHSTPPSVVRTGASGSGSGGVGSTSSTNNGSVSGSGGGGSSVTMMDCSSISSSSSGGGGGASSGRMNKFDPSRCTSRARLEFPEVPEIAHP